ncbi:hypothetical protein MGQ_04563, partial [Candida albicans P76067]
MYLGLVLSLFVSQILNLISAHPI